MKHPNHPYLELQDIRIEEYPTTDSIRNVRVYLAISFEIGVHGNECACCGAKTPLPTVKNLIDDNTLCDLVLVARSGYLSPSVLMGNLGDYKPEGWARVGGEMICAECNASVQIAIAQALAQRGRQR